MLKIVSRLTAILLLCLLFNTSTLFGQKIAPAELKHDIAILKDSLFRLHPGVERYTTKTEVTHIFDSCANSITDSMDVVHFFALANFLIASVKDGHANCRMSRDLMNKYMDTARIFPAMVLFIHQRPFIYCARQNDTLKGSAILSINDEPIDKIMARLFPYIPSDGNIQSRKDWEINENFPFLYQIIFGTQDTFRITCKDRNGQLQKVVLKADVWNNIKCPGPLFRPSRYLTLEYKPGGIALLTIRTFLDQFMQQTGEHFEQFMDSAMGDLHKKGITKLVIDVRGNQGGQDVNGAVLYSYLASKPFHYYASLETVKEKLPETAHPNLALQQPRPNAYHGQVRILINGRSFSATAEFAAVARSEERGKFYGEETGGGYYGNTSGDDMMVTLPASGITARIPLVKYTMAVKKTSYSDRGVIPDKIVYPGIMDFINRQTDAQLNAALSGKW